MENPFGVGFPSAKVQKQGVETRPGCMYVHRPKLLLIAHARLNRKCSDIMGRSSFDLLFEF